MRKKQLNIKWLDNDGVCHTGKVLPKDILVKDKEEFLLANTPDDRALRIRLDKITILE